MIMSSGRFSGGSGGGGSNRDVVFTARVQVDPKVGQAFAGLTKQVDDLQKRLNGLNVGRGFSSPGAGGVAGSGRVGGGVLSTAAQELREQQRQEQSMRRMADQERRAEDRRRASEERFWTRVMQQEQRSVEKTKKDRSKPLVTRGEFGEALEGLTSLARAAVFLGASSEKSAQQMLRSLLMFEAGAQAVRGGMKLSGPLGAVLGAGAAKIGMKAGAGSMGLGFAGMAAGVGVLGGGFAIADQIRYMQTGQIGAFSQGHANFGTRVARFGLNNGIDLSGRFGQAVGAISPLHHLMNATGYTQAVTARARGDMANEQGAMRRFGDTGAMLESSERRLANERMILSLMEREAAKQREVLDASMGRLQGIANNYQSLSPWEQRRAGALRDKFRSNPRSLTSDQLNSMRGLLGADENARIDQIMVERSGGFLSGGGAERERRGVANAIPTLLMQSATELQRTFTIQLEQQNQEAVQRFEQALTAALKNANEEMEESLNKTAERVERSVRQSRQNSLNQLNAQSNALGSGF